MEVVNVQWLPLWTAEGLSVDSGDHESGRHSEWPCLWTTGTISAHGDESSWHSVTTSVGSRGWLATAEKCIRAESCLRFLLLSWVQSESVFPCAISHCPQFGGLHAVRDRPGDLDLPRQRKKHWRSWLLVLEKEQWRTFNGHEVLVSSRGVCCLCCEYVKWRYRDGRLHSAPKELDLSRSGRTMEIPVAGREKSKWNVRWSRRLWEGCLKGQSRKDTLVPSVLL